jgi:hypothetical protein
MHFSEAEILERMEMVGREGLRGRDGGGDLTSVQYKPIWNGHKESSLYSEHILITKIN